jgi:uncharacterized phage-associated protein
MANVFDVAKFILEKCGRMTTWKLQKLVYYCQAWSLVWDEEPLFSEKIEAWANGPVVRELYNLHRRRFYVSGLSRGNSDDLNETQKETICAVIECYGEKSSQWLSDLAHMEEPWKKARKGISEKMRGSNEITHESMAEYYSSILPEEDSQ